MGGDGGVIASNRRYMRGAGTADHTGDYNNNGGNNKNADGNTPQEILTTCAITRTKFTPNSIIVACRFGKLYFREAAIQELLENKQRRKNKDKKMLDASPLAHVRKLSELYEVRFQYPESSATTDSPSKNSSNSNKTTETTATTITPICPMTSKQLVGTKIAAILLVPGNSDQPNVISESSWKQLTEQQWQEEYGPIEKRIRLAPPTTMLEELKEEYEQEVVAADSSDKKNKNKKKNKKKRQHDDDNDNTKTNTNGSNIKNNNGSTTTTTIDRSNKKLKHNNSNSKVASAIQSNTVLSSLFCSSDKTKDLSDKDHKDNLFART